MPLAVERYEVLINDASDAQAPPLSLEAPSLPVALIIAEINMGSGTAEIWQEDRRLARLRKRSASQQPYWELG